MKSNGGKWKESGGLGKIFPHDLQKVIKMLNMITHGFLVFHIIRNEVVGIRCSSSYRTEKYGESFKVEISNDLLQILGL